MENLTAQSISSRNLAVSFHPAKALGMATAKNSESASSPEMRQWIEQAQQYMTWYSGVVSGSIKLQPGEELPSDQEISQLQQWYQWATGGFAQQQWDPSLQGSTGALEGGPQLPPGATLGAQNNIVFNGETADVDYQPSSLPTDVLSDTLNLNIPVKAKVDVESTMDTRLNPATGVIKITVHDRTANPADTVYFVNAEAKININTIGGKDVTQHGTESLNLADGTPQVTVGTYQAKPAQDDNAGLAVETKNGDELDSEASDINDILNFAPKGAGKDTVTTHVPVGNSNIMLTLSDKVYVGDVSSEGTFAITITHKDGSHDVFKIQKGFTVNLQNVNPGTLTYGTADGEMSDAMKPLLTINGSAPASSEDNTPSVDTSGDTQPNAGSVKSGNASYTQNPTVELTNDFSNTKITNSKIIATEKFTLHVDYADSVQVTRDDTTTPPTYKIVVTQNGTTNKKCYTVQAGEIDLDAFNVDHKSVPTDDTVLKVLSEKSSTDDPDSPKGKAAKIKGSDIVGNVPTDGGDDWNPKQALELANLIGTALKTGNWADVNAYFTKHSSDWAPGNQNNIIRKVITGLYKAAGSDDDVFMELLKRIPRETRNQMISWVSFADGYEADEKADSDQWNSAGTAAKIVDSMDA